MPRQELRYTENQEGSGHKEQHQERQEQGGFCKGLWEGWGEVRQEGETEARKTSQF